MRKTYRSDYSPPPDFEKGGGLIPAIVQDALQGDVLMLGYMNPAALEETERSGRVTFYSRSKKRLWQKGETSGNFLEVESIRTDCDGDALLVKAIPAGVVCHSGDQSCFGDTSRPGTGFLGELDALVHRRKSDMPEGSYTTELFREGGDKIIQKTGEEAIEMIIEAKGSDRQRFLEEAADLVYHLTVLLAANNSSLAELSGLLEKRHKKKSRG